ncbi:uncharacterized protein LOC9635248 [Selaginella moellendorffii]|uniref:uncharacterized protein LOC9635248 n=1 Tax=Selaginella moellendorffii TaxID=88036 RepID=UPI000D1CA2DC|nr:uncharacterized protein LOC9635248 [Selaginella moellendorffii]|eukprot:XP_024542889.1 uncharacterized protein LOC9635248 [Selaginella moellendorffii]
MWDVNSNEGEVSVCDPAPNLEKSMKITKSSRNTNAKNITIVHRMATVSRWLSSFLSGYRKLKGYSGGSVTFLYSAATRYGVVKQRARRAVLWDPKTGKEYPAKLKLAATFSVGDEESSQAA